jgi:hypothetical protein
MLDFVVESGVLDHSLGFGRRVARSSVLCSRNAVPAPPFLITSLDIVDGDRRSLAATCRNESPASRPRRSSSRSSRERLIQKAVQ